MGIELTCSAKKGGIHVVSQAWVLVWMQSYRGPGSNVPSATSTICIL